MYHLSPWYFAHKRLMQCSSLTPIYRDDNLIFICSGSNWEDWSDLAIPLCKWRNNSVFSDDFNFLKTWRKIVARTRTIATWHLYKVVIYPEICCSSFLTGENPVWIFCNTNLRHRNNFITFASQSLSHLILHKNVFQGMKRIRISYVWAVL